MVRSVLVLLLLANYLLVLGAGLVNRSEKTSPPAAHPYVHSADCQQRNYLRLDCFDTCTGKASVQKKLPQSSLTHLLATAKGVDAHCLPAPAPAATQPTKRVAPGPVASAYQPAPQPGVRRRLDAPPRQA